MILLAAAGWAREIALPMAAGFCTLPARREGLDAEAINKKIQRDVFRSGSFRNGYMTPGRGCATGEEKDREVAVEEDGWGSSVEHIGSHGACREAVDVVIYASQ